MKKTSYMNAFKKLMINSSGKVKTTSNQEKQISDDPVIDEKKK